MNEIKEQLRDYIQLHSEFSAVQIKEEISRQLKGEIFSRKIDEMFDKIKKHVRIVLLGEIGLLI